MATETRLLTVALDGSGAYRQIQPALAAAQPGDTVLVRAGTYTEDLTLRQGVTLQGEGAERTRVVAAQATAVVARQITEAVVCALTLDGAGKANQAAVWLVGATVTLTDCLITGAALSGLEATEGAHLTLRDTTVRGNQQAGVYIHTQSEGLLEHNTLADNGLHGVAVKTRGRVTARGNTIQGNQVGVYIYEDGEGVLEANTIQGNQQSGVYIHEAGEGLLETNTLAENGLHGVSVRARGRVTARGNTIQGNQQCGVFIHEAGEGLLETNTLAENGYHGVEVRERGQVTLMANTIVRNTQCGVRVYQDGRAVVQHNIIACNTTRGVTAQGNTGQAPAAAVTLRRNCVWENQPNYEGDLDSHQDLVADPCFVGLTSGDYHLQPDSPCISAGEAGEDLGACPFVPPAPPPVSLGPPVGDVLVQLATWPLAHTVPPTPARPAAWLRSASAVGASLPLCLAQDLGTLLTQPRDQLTLARPAYLPAERDAGGYLACLQRLAALPLLRALSTWDLSDAVTGVVVAQLVRGVAFPPGYGLPAGAAAVAVARQLGAALDRAVPAQLWRETPAAQRPALAQLLPPTALAQIEANARRLDPDELRFLHRYGPRLRGAPDPRDLLDLRALLDLPPVARLAVTQMLHLLPHVSQTVGGHGGIHTAALGGYAELTRTGSLDSLVPTELAYPAAVFQARWLNREVLYYGREGEPARQRQVAYVVTQVGLGMQGDSEVLARAVTLALGHVLQRRGATVYQSFVGSRWTAPEGMQRPGDVQRVLHYRDAAWGPAEAMLKAVLGQVRRWGYGAEELTVYWVLGVHWDADGWEGHQGLYRQLRQRGGQAGWFVREGGAQVGRWPVTAGQFSRVQVLDTARLWQQHPPPSPALAKRTPRGKQRNWKRLQDEIERYGFRDIHRNVLYFDNDTAQMVAWEQLARITDDPDQGEIDEYLRSLVPEVMVYVPAGSFLMGSLDDDPEAEDNEKPRHEVWLPGYYIDRYPVTNEAYALFINAGGYQERTHWTQDGWAYKEREQWTAPRCWRDRQYNTPRQPAVGVSWYEAVAYACWAGKRLPTEAEWEKAASWDPTNNCKRRYPWGDVWHSKSANTEEAHLNGTSFVEQFSPQGDSAFGVADLGGNANEWCSSLSDRGYPYSFADGREDIEGEESRSLRGGSWKDQGKQKWSRCAFRGGFFPETWSIDRGFRCVWPQTVSVELFDKQPGGSDGAA